MRGATRAFGATEAHLRSEILGARAADGGASLSRCYLTGPRKGLPRVAKYEQALSRGHTVVPLISEVWGGFAADAIIVLPPEAGAHARRPPRRGGALGDWRSTRRRGPRAPSPHITASGSRLRSPAGWPSRSGAARSARTVEDARSGQSLPLRGRGKKGRGRDSWTWFMFSVSILGCVSRW